MTVETGRFGSVFNVFVVAKGVILDLSPQGLLF
jgi:hypothetical protein